MRKPRYCARHIASNRRDGRSSFPSIALERAAQREGKFVASFQKRENSIVGRPSAMGIRLVIIAVSATILGALHVAEAYTWPAIRYSPPDSCGKNETFEQNSFVCIRCGRAERPRDTAEGGLIFLPVFIDDTIRFMTKFRQVLDASVGRITGWSRIPGLTGRRRMGSSAQGN